jgi:hypothetical protein
MMTVAMVVIIIPVRLVVPVAVSASVTCVIAAVTVAVTVMTYNLVVLGWAMTVFASTSVSSCNRKPQNNTGCLKMF